MRKRKNGQDEIIQDLIRQLVEAPDIHVAKRLVRALERAGRGERVLDEPLSREVLESLAAASEDASGIVRLTLEELFQCDGDEDHLVDTLTQKLTGDTFLESVEWRIVDLDSGGGFLVMVSGSVNLDDADESDEDEPEVCAGCGGELLPDDGSQDDDHCFRCRARMRIGPTTGTCAMCDTPVLVKVQQGVRFWVHMALDLDNDHEPRPAGGADHEEEDEDERPMRGSPSPQEDDE